MLCHFHNRRVVKAIRYIIYAGTMHDQWKQTPYPIWFLRRCDSKPSNGNEGIFLPILSRFERTNGSGITYDVINWLA